MEEIERENDEICDICGALGEHSQERCDRRINKELKDELKEN